MKYQAVRKDGSVVKADEEITSFRGETWKFISVTRNGSRVYANQMDWNQEFFPSVFELEIKEDAGN